MYMFAYIAKNICNVMPHICFCNPNSLIGRGKLREWWRSCWCICDVLSQIKATKQVYLGSLSETAPRSGCFECSTPGCGQPYSSLSAYQLKLNCKWLKPMVRSHLTSVTAEFRAIISGAVVGGGNRTGS